MTRDTPLKIVVRKQTFLAVFTVFLLSILVCFLFVSVGLGSSDQDGVVGVKAGDWVTYGFYEADPFMQKKDWVRVQVVNVSGTSINYWILSHKNDQPEQNLTVTDDVSDVVTEYKYAYGSAHDGPLFLPMNFTWADFDAEFVKQAFGFSGNWNYSLATRTYVGQEREVNVINLTYSDALPLDLSLLRYREFYWDRMTGILFEQRYVEYEPSPSNSTINELSIWNDQYMKIADTDLWYVPHPSNTQLPKIVALGTILFGISAVAIKIRSNRKYEKKEI